MIDVPVGFWKKWPSNPSHRAPTGPGRSCWDQPASPCHQVPPRPQLAANPYSKSQKRSVVKEEVQGACCFSVEQTAWAQTFQSVTFPAERPGSGGWSPPATPSPGPSGGHQLEGCRLLPMPCGLTFPPQPAIPRAVPPARVAVTLALPSAEGEARSRSGPTSQQTPKAAGLLRGERGGAFPAGAALGPLVFLQSGQRPGQWPNMH